MYVSAVQLTAYPHRDSGFADISVTAGCTLKVHQMFTCVFSFLFKVFL